MSSPNGQHKPILITQINTGDPILWLDINEKGCLSGSSLGRVYFYSFLHNETVPSESDKTVSLISKPNKPPLSYLSKLFNNSNIKASDTHSQNPISSNKSENNGDRPSDTWSEIVEPEKPEEIINKHDTSNMDSIDSTLTQDSDNLGARLRVKEPPSESQSLNSKRNLILNDRTDLPVKFVYLTSEFAFVILENAQYFKWNLRTMDCENVPLTDWKIFAFPKELLIHKSSVLIASTRNSFRLNLDNGEHQPVDFTLFDAKLVPIDYNYDYVLSILRTYRNEFNVNIRGVNIVKPIKTIEIKDSIAINIPEKPFVTTACFWAPSRFILIIRSTIIRVYNYNKDSILDFKKHTGHKKDIVAIDASNPKYFLTISKDQTLKVWTSSSKKFLYSLSIKPALFDAGWPYFLKSYGKKVTFSSDKGVYITDLVIS